MKPSGVDSPSGGSGVSSSRLTGSDLDGIVGPDGEAISTDYESSSGEDDTDGVRIRRGPFGIPMRSGRKMTRRQLLFVVMISSVVLILVVGTFLMGSLGIPVDVYSKPTPPEGTDPYTVLPMSACGAECISVVNVTSVGYERANALYEGSIFIQVTDFAYESDASSYVSYWATHYESLPGSVSHLDVGSKHWMTYSTGSSSLFMWQKDTWVIEVLAPDSETRNSVAAALPY